MAADPVARSSVGILRARGRGWGAGVALRPAALQPPLPGWARSPSPQPHSAGFACPPPSTPHPPPPAQLPGLGPSPDLPPTRTLGESPSQTATAAQPQLVNQSAFCAPGPAAQSQGNPLPSAWKRTDRRALQGTWIFYRAKSHHASKLRANCPFLPRPASDQMGNPTTPRIWCSPLSRGAEEHSPVWCWGRGLMVTRLLSDPHPFPPTSPGHWMVYVK